MNKLGSSSDTRRNTISENDQQNSKNRIFSSDATSIDINSVVNSTKKLECINENSFKQIFSNKTSLSNKQELLAEKTDIQKEMDNISNASSKENKESEFDQNTKNQKGEIGESYCQNRNSNKFIAGQNIQKQELNNDDLEMDITPDIYAFDDENKITNKNRTGKPVGEHSISADNRDFNRDNVSIVYENNNQDAYNNEIEMMLNVANQVNKITKNNQNTETPGAVNSNQIHYEGKDYNEEDQKDNIYIAESIKKKELKDKQLKQKIKQNDQIFGQNLIDSNVACQVLHNDLIQDIQTRK